MSRLLVTDAIIRARKLGFIARENANKTRLWFYRGDEDKKSTWRVKCRPITISGATVSLADFEESTR
jgi:hypothetical protein